MITPIDYALIAGRAYQTNRNPINQFAVTEGWEEFAHVPNNPNYPQFTGISGFEAVSFVKGSEIVISFAGTNFKDASDWTQANVPLAFGLLATQLIDAAKYYLEIKAQNSNATITLTGHSLGGGLAALIAVMFDETAVTFDQAPFNKSAMFFNTTTYDANGSPTVTTTSVAQALRQELTGGQYESMLVKLDAYIAANSNNSNPIAEDTVAARSANVTNTNTQGEILSSGELNGGVFERTGSQVSIANGHAGASPIELHSQAFLAALLQSGDTENSDSDDHTLGQVSLKLNDLLKMIFDPNLYYFSPTDIDNNKNPNFLELIVNHQAGFDPRTQTEMTGNEMVTRFTADLWKLAQEEGLTISDGLGVNTINNVSKTLTAFAMQFYYEDTENAKDATKELFKDLNTGGPNSNGVQFDIADVSKDIKAAIDAGQDIDLSKAKGYKEYFKSYIEDIAKFSIEEQKLIVTLLPTLRDWYVQAGTNGMTVTDLLNRGAFLLGGAEDDNLTGGTANDLLIGNAGNDTINGGHGNDILLGDAGNDTYLYNTGDGFDTIIDRGGEGSIIIDGNTLAGGSQYGDARVYRDAQGHTYTNVGNSVIIDGNIRIQHWQAGNLGVTMTGPATPPANPTTTRNIAGDLSPIDFDQVTAGVQVQLDEIGNLIADTNNPETNRVDLLLDSTGNDHIMGGGGDDIITAFRGGDDVIEGGAGNDVIRADGGNDVVLGGTGNDVLSGGVDDDRLYANSQISVIDAINNGNTSTGTGLKADWLAGGSGNDQLIGSSGNDVLSGGGGNDLLIGGAGDDYLLGDSDYLPTQVTTSIFVYGNTYVSPYNWDWKVTPGANNVYTFSIASDSVDDPEDSGNDVIYAGNGNDVAWGGRGNDVIFGEAGHDVLSGDQGNDILMGGAGDDKLYGGDNDDYLDGGNEADTIFGGEGNDFIIGGQGNDILNGGTGQDTYIFNSGDGIDTINDTLADNNIISFGEGVIKENIKLRLGSLMLDLGNGDAVHIANFDQNDVFNSSSIKIFSFADGSTLIASELLARGFDLDGTAESDVIVGTSTIDRINGLEGDDVLDGGAGNDVLQGGQGNDLLKGGAGDELYLFELGDGFDSIEDSSGINQIKFGDGITLDSIRLSQYTATNGNTYLLVKYGDGQDEIAIKDGIQGNIQSYVFSDGTTISQNSLITLKDVSRLITGTNGDDVIVGASADDMLSGEEGVDSIVGGNGNDVLDGGSGNDTLEGGAGSDSYVLSWAMGKDIVIDGDDGEVNRITFEDETLRVSDLRRVKVGDDLFLNIRGSEQGLVIKNYYLNNQLWDFGQSLNWDGEGESIDVYGTDSADFLQATEQGSMVVGLNGDDTLIGNVNGDALFGGAGEDILIGGAGSDWLEGGSGNDVLEGGDGEDSYYFVWGGGQDVVVDGENGETNYIELSSQIKVMDLTSSRVGDDLILGLKEGPEKLTLKNYYLDSQQWLIGFDDEAEGYQQIDLQELIETTQSIQNQIEAQKVAFENKTKAMFYQVVRENGLVKDRTSGNNSYEYSNFVYSGAVNYDTEINIQGEYTYSTYTSSTQHVITNVATISNTSDYSYFKVPTGYFPYGTPGFIPPGYSYKLGAEGFWVYPKNTNINPNVVETTYFYTNKVYTNLGIQKITANDLDNNISVNRFSMVDSGSGNDFIRAVYSNIGIFDLYDHYDDYKPFDARDIGVLLYGNAGDDVILGGEANDVLIGGDGQDELDGTFGADTYLVFNESTVGKDIIRDSGHVYIPNELGYDRYDLGYYTSLGYNVNSQQFRSDINKPPRPDRPLPSDYAALSSWYAAGAIERDVVEFAEGINLSDLTFSWGQHVVSEQLDQNGFTWINGALTVTLDITWGGGKGVSVAVPVVEAGGGHYIGSGIEQFEFADGTVVSMADMLQLAPPMPTRATYLFEVGSGSKTLNIQNAYIQLDSNILITDISIEKDGYDVIFTHRNGQDQLRLKYADQSYNSNTTTIGVILADGTILKANEIAHGTQYHDSLSGRLIFGNEGGDYLYGTGEINYLFGGLDSDTYVVRDGDHVFENIDEGEYDTVETELSYTLGANLEVLRLIGVDAIDGTGNELGNTLVGNEAANILSGGLGDDYLDGSQGDDTLIGGEGSDIYFYGLGGSRDVIDNVALDNGSTVDSLQLYDIAPESVVLSRVLDDLLITISATDSVTIKDYYAGNNNKIDQIQFFVYDPVAEIYTETIWDSATFEAQVISSNHAPEVSGSITSLTAEDGSAMNYVLPVSTLFTDVDPSDALTYTVTLADGNPLPAWLNYESATYTLSGTPDPTHIGNLTLSVVATDLSGATASIDFDLTVAAMPDQSLIGTTANNNLVGGSGNDTLDGLAGTDTMSGGYGNDTYFVERSTDKVIELTNQGIDTINTTVTYTASASVENLTLLGTASITANGNELNNVLTGNTGNNTLDGKAGVDSMLGGLGNDTYVVDDVGDVVTELENEGTDTVKSSVDYTLGDHVERLTLTGTTAINATGNTLNNILIGNDIDNQLVGGEGNDNLNGGLGVDTLIGGLGNDTYVVENALEVVIEQVGEGTDVVQASVTYTLAADVENLTLTGTATINGTGNDLNNTLTGNTVDNQLAGGSGNDNLNGGLGADTLIGGLGNDVYTVDNVNDVVTELAGEGTDRVNSSIDYTLGAELENLTLTGAVAVSATGNELNNTLTGNTADNVLIGNAGNDNLNGGTGADTMLGGLDNDTYTVDNVNDVVTELVGEGTDRVNSGISYTLGDNLENLTLTGAMDIMGFGNNLANVLAGNTGNNYLYGLAANDTITGNNGDDVLQGGDDNDTISGNAGNGLLDGGSGNDRLTGGIENDLFIGGTGNDTIITGTGFDVIVFNKGDGADNVSASTGGDNTLSLGGNSAYSDLSLTKTGNNLILKMGATDQITFSNWYLTSPTNKSVVNLQVIAEAMQGFSLGGADDLRNNTIETFNFSNLVAAFDAAGATANWQLTDARLTAHLQAGSDTAAIGGDLAYQYGKNSNLTGMGLLNAQSVISNASFGQTAQTLNNPSVWQAELVKMA